MVIIKKLNICKNNKILKLIHRNYKTKLFVGNDLYFIYFKILKLCSKNV